MKDALSGIIFTQIISNGLMLAASIMQVDMYFGQWSQLLFFSMYSGFVSIGSTYLFCYFSAKSSHKLRMMPGPVYNSLWYKSDTVQQRDTVMMLMFAQIERNFHGLGIFNCNLQVFLQVSFSEISILYS